MGLFMEKVDFKKELKDLYRALAKEVTVIDVPDMNFLMVDDQGALASLGYQQAIEDFFR